MIPPRLLWPALIAATVLFWSVPLFQPNVTIHWDMADTAYPAQAYTAESFHTGELPHWTPYLSSGTLFLADPRVGAWYPLHWPFFLIGITPRAMQWELALHAFIALSGAFFLVRRLLHDTPDASTAALIAAPLYAWSGFFAAYSSRLATFEAAALTPWLLWAVIESRLVAAAAIGGLVVLTGDFETAVYALAAAALVGAIHRALYPVAAAISGAVLLGATVWVPWLAIRGDMVRTGEPAKSSLVLSALGTLMNPDQFDLFTGLYSGPGDIRHFYFYASLLLIPLTLAGLFRKHALPVIGALIVAPLLYAFAASVQIWFLVALGLAIAAGSGAAHVAQRSGRRFLPYLLLVLIVADLWHWNMYRGPLVYARLSYEDLYGKRLREFEASIRPLQGTEYLLWSPAPSPALGPAGGPLLIHANATWGAGLLQPKGYAEVLQRASEDPAALNELGVTHTLDARGRLIANPGAQPRAGGSPADHSTPRLALGASISIAGLLGLVALGFASRRLTSGR